MSLPIKFEYCEIIRGESMRIAEINSLGDLGWEMAGVWRAGSHFDDYTIYYFKRVKEAE